MFCRDTGLEVEALNGEPGVYSARYAGDGHNAEANMLKLLHAMEGIENRKAQFRTAFALIIDGKEHLFEGVTKEKSSKPEEETPVSDMILYLFPKDIHRLLQRWATN